MTIRICLLYNKDIYMDCCNICKSTDKLETHHIVPQAVAKAKGNGKKISPGKHMNTKERT